MMGDAEIIDLLFKRDQQAIRELDTKYGKACYRLSYNIVNDRQDAEECVNDAYLGAWNTIPPARPDPLLTYLCKIVRNTSLNNYYRKKAAKRSGGYGGDRSLHSISRHSGRRDRSQRVSPHHRELFGHADR